MITAVPNDRCGTYFGKSTDEKPIENVGNGSQFIEQDTSKIFLFDEENKKWLEFKR